MKQGGYNKLWSWFSCSRASFLVLPRVLMHEMPDHWQWQMTTLLEQYEKAFPNQPDLSTRVQCVRDRKLVKWPEWILNYRRPDQAAIAECRDRHACPDCGATLPTHKPGCHDGPLRS